MSDKQRLKDRLGALRAVIVDALATRDPDAPGWVYGPLAHSLDEVEEMIEGIDEDASGLVGAEGVAKRAEIAIDLWKDWAQP